MKITISVIFVLILSCCFVVKADPWLSQSTAISREDKDILCTPKLHTFSMCLMPDNSILLVACGGHLDWGEVDLIQTRSFDGGVTWTTPTTLFSSLPYIRNNDTNTSIMDPTLVRYYDTIFLFLTARPPGTRGYNDSYLYMYTSTDNGYNWSEPTNFSDIFYRLPWYTGGSQLSTPSYFIDEKDHLFLSVWGHEQVKKDTQSGLLWLHDGQWDIFGKVHVHGNLEANHVLVSDGRIMTYVRPHQSYGNPIVAYSGNKGQYFHEHTPWMYNCTSTRNTLITYSSYVNNNTWSKSHDVFYGKERVLFAFVNASNRYLDMSLGISYDDGETWKIKNLWSAGAYSDIVINRNGTIVVAQSRGGYRDIRVSVLNLEWLTDGNDFIETNETTPTKRFIDPPSPASNKPISNIVKINLNIPAIYLFISCLSITILLIMVFVIIGIKESFWRDP